MTEQTSPGPEPEQHGDGPVTTALQAPSEYTAALEKVLPLAKAEILVFDRDLAIGDWGTIARTELLRRFLLENRRSRLEIVVHDTHMIEKSMPRLTALLRDFSHKFQVLRTTDDSRNATEGFVLVDGRHLIHRFHFDSMRGESSIDNPRKTALLRERYDEVITYVESGVNATQLGL